MQIIDKLIEEGVDMEAGKYVILDEQSHLIVQSDCYDVVMQAIKEKKPKCVIYIDLDGIRKDDYVFF